MIIKSKYSIGDEVWIIINNKVVQNVVESIEYNVNEYNNIKFFYHLHSYSETTFMEDSLFETKEDLLKTL